MLTYSDDLFLLGDAFIKRLKQNKFTLDVIVLTPHCN